MKKLALIILMSVVMSLCACSNKGTDDNNTKEDPKTEISSEVTEDKENANESTDESSQSDTKNEGEENNTKVYIGDSVVDIAMGSENGASSTKLCDVKMGANYLISGKCINELGEKEQIGASVSPQVSEVSLEDSFVAEAVVRAQGDVNDEYIFMISPSTQYNVDMVKEKIPNGVEVNYDGNHQAYITDEGRFDALFIYALNNDWVLVVEYTGDLTKNMNLDELGKEFYQLVTPVN